ncbi:diacylglycerol kinase family protein [Candidatus Parcubacteria bacterium]|nr:diacylglycerol kinase family protein [Candidatus Parcubacteria bacterium]
MEKFSVEKRIKSFGYAWRGIEIFLKTTHNVWLHVLIFIVVVLAGFYFNITQIEWFAIILSAGAVFVAEAFNTAIEIDIDLTSPDFHPRAKDTKDVAAGAVLISALTAIVIGVIIFYPYLCTFV